MPRTRRFRGVPFLTLLLSMGGCSFMKPDPAGTYPVFVKTVPATRLAAVERPGKSYFSIGGDLGNLAKSPLWNIRAGPLQATYYVNTRKDRKTPPSSDAALPIPAGAAVPAPFVAKDVPAQTVAYAFWRGDVFRGFKVDSLHRGVGREERLDGLGRSDRGLRDVDRKGPDGLR